MDTGWENNRNNRLGILRTTSIGKSMTTKNKVLENLKQYLTEYDSIYILSNKDYIYTPFLRSISSITAKKYLLLVAGPEKECTPVCGLNIHIQPVSHKEYQMIENLYYLYEFSDRIHFLNHRASYGCLDNYIINGLLTEEEAATVLLK